MVEQIELFIKECRKDGFSDKETAGAILDLVEEFGMLPPYNPNHGVSTYYIAMGCSDRLLHRWESEDEKN